MTPREALRHAGIATWLDTLSRDLIDSGHFAELIDEAGVTGATSNPTIFAAAMSRGTGYDEALDVLVAQGVTAPQELFVALALEDVRRAADLLAPVHQATGGSDGFVSFQVTPDLAHDTAAMVEQAVQLQHRLGRPNVLIKVPATAAGVTAVEELTALGVNVNVTLVFSLRRYGEVMEAYHRGLQRRLAHTKALHKAKAVSSFFVSRIDGRVDPLLEVDSPLRGTAAVAGAAAAYHSYRRALTDPAWQPLLAAGARPPRPLWASTATKDPAYSDAKYLEELLTPGAIITTPEPTLRAFLDHGRPRPPLSTSDSAALLAQLGEAGVQLDEITASLEQDGVAAFQDNYEQLLSTLAAKAKESALRLTSVT